MCLCPLLPPFPKSSLREVRKCNLFHHRTHNPLRDGNTNHRKECRSDRRDTHASSHVLRFCDRVIGCFVPLRLPIHPTLFSFPLSFPLSFPFLSLSFPFPFLSLLVPAANQLTPQSNRHISHLTISPHLNAVPPEPSTFPFSSRLPSKTQHLRAPKPKGEHLTFSDRSIGR